MLRNLRFILFIVIALGLSSCLSTNDSSSSSTAVPNDDSTTILSVLPDNGGTIYASSANFTVVRDSGVFTTGSIGILGGARGGIITLKVTAPDITTSKLPVAILNPDPCILNSKDSTISSCQIHMSADKNTAIGTYLVTPTFVSDNGVTTVLNSFSITTVDSGHIPGNLSIAVNTDNLSNGESTIATISLTNSIDVTDLNVTITTANSSLLSVSPSSCKLSTEKNSCVVVATVISTQTTPTSTTIQANATGYKVSNSTNIYIDAFTIPGTLNITLENTVVQNASQTVATISLDGALGINNLPVYIVSSDPSIGSVSQSSCTITGSEVGQNTCQITIVAESFGVTSLTVSANDDYDVAIANLIVPIAYAYVIDTDNNGVIEQFSVLHNGQLNQQISSLTADSTGSTSWNPVGMVFNNNYAYIADKNTNNSGSGNIWFYQVDNSGAFNFSGVITPPPGVDWKPNDIDISDNHAYVTDETGNVWQFTVGESGVLNNPESVPAPTTSWLPISLSVNDNYVYVINDDSTHSLWRYSINMSTGALMDPTQVPNLLGSSWTPQSIGFSGNYAYVTDGSNGLWQFVVNNAGLINSPESIAAPLSLSSWEPHAITFYSKYAYIADSNTDNTFFGNMWLYNVDFTSTKTLESPIQSLVNTKQWQPEEIVFYIVPTN